jgi:hypothetical protein
MDGPTEFFEIQKTHTDEQAWQGFLDMLVEGREIVESKARFYVRMIVAIARLYE